MMLDLESQGVICRFNYRRLQQYHIRLQGSPSLSKFLFMANSAPSLSVQMHVLPGRVLRSRGRLRCATTTSIVFHGDRLSIFDETENWIAALLWKWHHENF